LSKAVDGVGIGASPTPMLDGLDGGKGVTPARGGDTELAPKDGTLDMEPEGPSELERASAEFSFSFFSC